MKKPTQTKQANMAQTHIKQSKAAAKAESAIIDDVLRSQLSKPAQRHLEMLVDPKRAKPARPVYSLGGNFDTSQLAICKTELDFATGTNQIGFCAMNPWTAGPSTDLAAIMYTTSSNTLTAASLFPATTSTGLVTPVWQVGGVFNSTTTGRTDWAFRTVAAAIYVTPTASATAQNGVLYLCEVPTHGYTSAMTIQQVMSGLNTRIVRGVQTGDPSIENVVNWHPKQAPVGFGSSGGYGDALMVDDFIFRLPTPSSTPGLVYGDSQIIAVAQGAAGTTFHASCYAVYELVGLKMYDPKPRYYDDQGWSYIQNAIASKRLSGWLGPPQMAQSAYQHAVVSAAAKADDLEPEAEKSLGKVEKGDTLFDTVKSLAPSLGEIAKEAVGFLL